MHWPQVVRALLCSLHNPHKYHPGRHHILHIPFVLTLLGLMAALDCCNVTHRGQVDWKCTARDQDTHAKCRDEW